MSLDPITFQMLQASTNQPSNEEMTFPMDDESEILRSPKVGNPEEYGEVLVDLQEDWKLLGVTDRYDG